MDLNLKLKLQQCRMLIVCHDMCRTLTYYYIKTCITLQNLSNNSMVTGPIILLTLSPRREKDPQKYLIELN